MVEDMGDDNGQLKCWKNTDNSFHYPERVEVPSGRHSWNIMICSESYGDIVLDFTHNDVLENMKNFALGAPQRWSHPAVLSESEKLAVLNTLVPTFLDSKVSFSKVVYCCYQDANGYALNPAGRTGLEGRGLCGRFGPNHAADIILSYIDDKNGEVHLLTIRRKDTGQDACVGGMVDPPDLLDVTNLASTTLRELEEEATDTGDTKSECIAELKQHIADGNIYTVYGGPVDDERGTDHAWIVTTVYVVPVSEEFAKRLPLQEENDEVVKNSVRWRTWNQLTSNPKGIFASHKMFMWIAIEKMRSLRRITSLKRTLDTSLSLNIGKAQKLAMVKGQVSQYRSLPLTWNVKRTCLSSCQYPFARR